MALVDNLVSYWKFDDNGTDSHGSNSLTAVNAPSYVAAKLNNGADIERGSAQGFTKSHPTTGLETLTDFTFNLWVNMETVAGLQPFIFKRVGTGNQRSYNFYFDTNILDCDLYSDGSSLLGSVSVSWTPTVSTWYMVSCTREGTSVKFWVNGSQQGTTQTVSSGATYDGTADLNIGHWVADGQVMDGILDEFGVWSRALSEAELTTLYNSGTPYPYSSINPPAPAATSKLTLLGVS